MKIILSELFYENVEVLDKELQWLLNNATLAKEALEKQQKFTPTEAPNLDNAQGTYANMVRQFRLSNNERIIIILSLVPHLEPDLLNILWANKTEEIETIYGGFLGKLHKGIIPTGQTALFLLGATHHLLRQIVYQQYFTDDSKLYKLNILRLEQENKNEPYTSGILQISKEYLYTLTTGLRYIPSFSEDFPAQYLSTTQSWDDLVLDYHTKQEIDEVKAWLKHSKSLLQDPHFAKELKGYRCLFYGEPGTGKTMTANLLGNEVGLDVFRIDLSKVVSKYIGETEKNLAKVFDQAENKNWILFFDEGDALFGKRTQTKSSNDRYANQEVSFLLQKIEDHKGVIILATNIKSNMDKAFLRRFQTEVYFPIPDEHARLELLEKAFTGNFHLESDIDLREIARKYEITGAMIKNLKHYCAIMALDRNTDIITKSDFLEGLKKQILKEGKTWFE